MATTYQCSIFVQMGRLRGRTEDPHLNTTDIAKLKKHQEEVLGGEGDARKHMLDILSESGLEGMCLPDVIIDPEKGTVQHFMDARREGQAPRGRRL